jgi:hypothetical protein
LTEAEKMIASSSDGTLLISVLEKAYGQYLKHQHPEEHYVVAAEACHIVMNWGDNNGMKLALHCLTGHDVDVMDTARTWHFARKEDFVAQITDARSHNRVAFLGIQGRPGQDLERLGIHGGHAYEVAYDENTRDFVVRDPLDHSHRGIHISWDQLNYNFNHLFIEKEK